MLTALIITTIICGLYCSYCASQGKECLLALNITLIVVNVAYLGIDSIMLYRGSYEFAWYLPVNVFAIVFAIRGILRCRDQKVKFNASDYYNHRLEFYHSLSEEDLREEWHNENPKSKQPPWKQWNDVIEMVEDKE